ncbi:MAG: YdeI/OmpD-associated family protein [Pacificimonas sp.]|nr:YdeI/OmpD-associated family protein [Pacificimonas sp.]
MDPDRFARIEVQTEAALWAWLADHHVQPDSVWLVTWKAQHRDFYVSREAVLDALIAHGWIDGRRMKLDEARTMQLISPRRQQAWAQSYKTRAARLEAEGRMHPAGRAAVERGQASGLWHASDPVDALNDPDELVEALEQAGALNWWRAAAPSYRRNILRWIAQAKRSGTRANRIATVTSHAARGQKVPQY